VTKQIRAPVTLAQASPCRRRSVLSRDDQADSLARVVERVEHGEIVSPGTQNAVSTPWIFSASTRICAAVLEVTVPAIAESVCERRNYTAGFYRIRPWSTTSRLAPHPQDEQGDRGRRPFGDWFRPSYFAAKYMLEHGYTVIPVNPDTTPSSDRNATSHCATSR